MLQRVWLLSFIVLTACSSQEVVWLRGPANVSLICNRQALGEAVSDNSALVEYNSKRISIVVQLLKKQVEQLKLRTALDASVSNRVQILEKKLQSLASGEVHYYDEPNAITWKLSRALDAYVQDLDLDFSSDKLSENDKKNFQYVKTELVTNLSQVEFWVPDFCKSITGKKSANFFKDF